MTRQRHKLKPASSYTCLSMAGNDPDDEIAKIYSSDKLASSTPCLLSSDDGDSNHYTDPELDMICTVRYRSIRIKMYKRSSQPDRMFYYEPIVVLNPHSIESRSISTGPAGKSYVRFTIHMWNDEIQQAVVKRAGRFSSLPVDDDDVQVLPYEKISLEMKSTGCYSTWGTVRLPQHPVSYRQLDQSLDFYLQCPSKEAADILANELRENPGFSTQHLALECKGLSLITWKPENNNLSENGTASTKISSSSKPSQSGIIFSFNISCMEEDQGSAEQSAENKVWQPKSHWTEGVLSQCQNLQQRLNGMNHLLNVIIK